MVLLCWVELVMHFGLCAMNVSDAISLLWYLCCGRLWEDSLQCFIVYTIVWEGNYTASFSLERISMISSNCTFFHRV